jgi:hypothetical protein
MRLWTIVQTTRRYLQLLESKTAEDHLRATDELLSAAPTEFAAAASVLQRSERFVFAAASGQVEVVSHHRHASCLAAPAQA